MSVPPIVPDEPEDDHAATGLEGERNMSGSVHEHPSSQEESSGGMPLTHDGYLTQPSPTPHDVGEVGSSCTDKGPAT
eukprot:5532234-Karenia_brevis.AAC.1